MYKSNYNNKSVCLSSVSGFYFTLFFLFVVNIISIFNDVMNFCQREENEKEKVPNVLSSVGEWGQEDREREPSEFEKENPNILLLNGSGEFKDM